MINIPKQIIYLHRGPRQCIPRVALPTSRVLASDADVISIVFSQSKSLSANFLLKDLKMSRTYQFN